MSQALYRKWRPKTWDEVVGQEHIVQTLRNAIAGNRVGHAYLFSGPRGTGKTTTARLLAKAVNCLAPNGQDKPCDACENCLAVDEGSFLDLIEIDAASNTSVDDVRDLRDKINYSPNKGKYKVYIIDEVHMLSTAAFNAILKTLEEPPDHAIFILATTEIHKIPATVLSRCQRYEFRKLSVPVISGLLQKKALEEGFEIDPPVLTLIARQATGSLRDGISLLDQLASTSQHITLELAESVLGTAAGQHVIRLVDALAEHDLSTGLTQIQQSLDTGSDPRQYARQMVDYLRNLLFIQVGDANLVEATKEQVEVMAAQARHFSQAELLSAVSEFTTAAGDTRASSWQPGLALEMALVRYLTPEETVSQASVRLAAAASPVAPQASTALKQNPVEVTAPPGREATLEATVREPVEDSPETGNDFDRVQQNWKKIAETIRKYSPATQGLTNSARLTGIQDGCLTLGFASDILKNKMESNDHREITRRAIREVTGVDLPIRCEVIGEKSTTPRKGTTTDSLVNSVMNEFGGQIKEIKEIKRRS